MLFLGQPAVHAEHLHILTIEWERGHDFCLVAGDIDQSGLDLAVGRLVC